MHRRSFLSLSALSAVPVVARAAEDAPDWQETITSDVMKFRCSDAEDRVVFVVELFQPAESDIKKLKDENGEFQALTRKRKQLVSGIRPATSLVS